MPDSPLERKAVLSEFIVWNTSNVSPGIRNHTFAGKLERINCGYSIGMSAS